MHQSRMPSTCVGGGLQTCQTPRVCEGNMRRGAPPFLAHSEQHGGSQTLPHLTCAPRLFRNAITAPCTSLIIIIIIIISIIDKAGIRLASHAAFSCSKQGHDCRCRVLHSASEGPDISSGWLDQRFILCRKAKMCSHPGCAGIFYPKATLNPRHDADRGKSCALATP